MDIRDVKISGEDWIQFTKYIDMDDLIIQIGVSLIIFELDREDTTFKDIVEIVKGYHIELSEQEEMQDFYLWREQLSSVDPIFFQKYAKEEHGVSIDNYQEQANCGAIYYCEDFINKLYEKMNKDGLFDRE